MGTERGRAAMMARLSAMTEEERRVFYEARSAKRRETMAANRAQRESKQTAEKRVADAYSLSAEPSKTRRRGRPRREAEPSAASYSNSEEQGRIRQIMGGFFSLEGISDALGATTETMFRYIQNDKLRGVEIAGRWFVSEKNFRKFLRGE